MRLLSRQPDTTPAGAPDYKLVYGYFWVIYRVSSL